MPTDSRVEEHGSPEEKRDTYASEFTATRTFKCKWEDRYHVRGLLCDNGGEPYPGSTGGHGARCRHATVVPYPGTAQTGVDEESGLPKHEFAQVIATYSSPRANTPQPDPQNPNPQADEILSEMLEPTAEYVTVDHRLLRWATESLKTDGSGEWENRPLTADEAPGRLVTGQLYTLTRHNLQSLPPGLNALVGSLNSQPIKLHMTGTPPIEYAAEQCLMMPWQFNKTTLADGTARVQLTLKMHWRNIPSWNKVYRPAVWGFFEFGAYDSIQYRNWQGAWVELKLYDVKNWAEVLPSYST